MSARPSRLASAAKLSSKTGLPPAMRAIKGATYTLERSTSGRDAIVVTVSGSYWPVSTAIVDAFASRRNRG